MTKARSMAFTIKLKRVIATPKSQELYPVRKIRINGTTGMLRKENLKMKLQRSMLN
jgi:hypothetical protein